MRQKTRLGMIIALALLGTPALGLAKEAPKTASKPVAQPTEQSLHDRIGIAYDGYAKTRSQTPIEPLKALMDEAEATRNIDAIDYAKIAIIYAYRLGHKREFEAGLSYVNKALDRLRAAHQEQTSHMGDLLLARAILLDQLGRFDEALESKYAAITVYESLGPDYGPNVALAKVQLGYTLLGRGRIREAMAIYDEGLELMRDNDQLFGSYVLQTANLASAKRLIGDMDGSLQTARIAYDAAKARLQPSDLGYIYALYNLGTTLMEMGRYGEAESLLRQAADLAAQYRGRQSPEALGFGFRLAQTIARQGRTEDALILLINYREAVKGATLGGNMDLPAQMDLEIGTLYLEQGNLKDASFVLDRGLEAIAGVGEIGNTTRASLNTRRAEAYVYEGNYEKAETHIDAALSYYEKEMPAASPLRVNASSLQSLIWLRRGKKDEALQKAKSLYDTMFAHLGDLNLTIEEQRDIGKPYMMAFGRVAVVALEAGDEDLAFRAAQLTAYSEMSATAQAFSGKALAKEEKTRALYDDLSVKRAKRAKLGRERSYALGKSETEVSRIDAEISTVEQDLDGIVKSLNRVDPQFRALSQPRVLSIVDAQKGLGAREAVLIPVFIEDQVASFVVTRKTKAFVVQAMPRPIALGLIERVRSSVVLLRGEVREFDLKAAYGLGAALVGPQTQKALKGVDTIQIVGAGPIMTVPFSLLVLSNPATAAPSENPLRQADWLVKHYATVVKPALNSTPPKSDFIAAAGAFFGIGAPALNGEEGEALSSSASMYRGSEDNKMQITDVEAIRRLPRLPQAAQELTRMKAALRLNDNEILTGPMATETAVKNLPKRRYEVMAFATHGLMEGQAGSLHEPALVLTPPSNPTELDDGLLSASEVAAMNLDVKWVILSACNTGSGREAGAEGYTGMASAFLQAGAESLLVSLWPVRDDVADRLSVDTVRFNAQGLSKPKALQKATLRLLRDTSIKDGAHPAVWAPFSLLVR